MLLGGAPGQQSQADLANMFDDSQLPMVAVPPLPPPVAPLPILMVPETQLPMVDGSSDATQVIDESAAPDLDPAADAPGATQPTPVLQHCGTV